MGIVGPDTGDSKNQQWTLPNGDKINRERPTLTRGKKKMLLSILRIAFIPGLLAVCGGFGVGAAELCVTVNDILDLPLSNAWVNVTALIPPAGNDAATTYNTAADSKGRACLTIPEGAYSVEVGLTGFLNVRYFPVRVVYPHLRDLSFRLPFGDVIVDSVAPEAVISGTLSFEGKPVEFAKICILQKDSPGVVTCGKTNVFGEYALSVPPGTFRTEIRTVDGGVYRSSIAVPRPGSYRNGLVLSGNEK
jgi:hypothetical protein